MVSNFKKIFTIHFPEKRVYIEEASGTLYDRMEIIKNDKDDNLYFRIKEYPNPEIRFECYKDKYCNKKRLALRYYRDSYEILNVNVLPYNYKSKNN